MQMIHSNTTQQRNGHALGPTGHSMIRANYLFVGDQSAEQYLDRPGMVRCVWRLTHTLLQVAIFAPVLQHFGLQASNERGLILLRLAIRVDATAVQCRIFVQAITKLLILAYQRVGFTHGGRLLW